MSPGTVIREARMDAGLSQSELAARAGTTQSAVARLESDSASPRVDTLQRLVAACGSRLELRAAPPLPTGIDETLVARRLRMSPADRLRTFEETYADVRRLAVAAQRSRD